MDRETSDDIKRHFDVVAEGLRSEIRAVDEKAERRFEKAEQWFEIADQRFEKADEKADRRFENADRRFEKLERRFDEANARFDELKRHFDVVGESLRSDIRLVAEGVAGLDEKFTREFVTVREEIGEVKSLVRVSYGDLDRRVQALERKPT